MPQNRNPQAVLTLTFGDAPGEVIADASASFARNGTITDWRMEFVGTGTTIADTGHPSDPVPFTFDSEQERYDVNLYVEDQRGRMSMVTGTIYAATPNQPPRAVLTLVRAQYAGEVVRVSTLGSTDEDGTIVLSVLDWADGSDPIEIAGPPNLEYDYVYDAAGTYAATLTLTDNVGAGQTTTVSITVTVAPPPPEPDPEPPVEEPLPENPPPRAELTYVSGQFATEPHVFSTEGTAGLDQPSLASGSVNWGDSTSPTTWGTTLPLTVTHTYAAPGTYVITYSVTSVGGITTTITRTVVVQAAPVVVQPPPVPTLIRTGGLYEDETFAFALGASSPTGSIATWSWVPGDGTSAVGGVGTPPATRTHVYVTPGAYSARLTVVDSFGRGAFATVSVTVLSRPTLPPATGGAHAGFDALVAHPAVWRAFSFREASQLGGASFVTYSPGSDTDPQAQDAAKVVIHPFFQSSAVSYLAANLGAADTQMTIVGSTKGGYPAGRVLKIDSEIVTVSLWVNATTVQITRAQYGTSAAAHSSGAAVQHAGNSLRSQVRKDLMTSDGNDYFFMWDAYWTDSFIGAGRFNHKLFQFSSGSSGGDQIWLEPRISYNYPGMPGGGVVGKFHVHPYNKAGGVLPWTLEQGDLMGPGETIRTNPASYELYAGRWTRFFMRIQQRANDYDIVNVWVSDTLRAPYHLHTDELVSVRPTGRYPNVIKDWWIEFNSSEDSFLRTDQRVLVAYVRNFVALKGAGDPTSLMGQAAIAQPSA